MRDWIHRYRAPLVLFLLAGCFIVLVARPFGTYWLHGVRYFQLLARSFLKGRVDIGAPLHSSRLQLLPGKMDPLLGPDAGAAVDALRVFDPRRPQ